MRIRARLCMSADGYITTPNGWPPQVVDPVHGHGSHGMVEFLKTCEAALMGRTTFEPALTNEWWPWPDLQVTVPVPVGAMAVIWVLESMVNVVAWVPNRTVKGPTLLNPEPVITTEVKTVAGPEEGVREVRTGAMVRLLAEVE